ncbi:MAG: M56 family metallopeptidase [Rhodanobacteraceae bacterium]
MNIEPVFLTAIQVLGWTLVHFVWQAALVGAVYAIVRVWLPRGEPRYLLGMLALVVLAACPLLTAAYVMAGTYAVVDAGAVVVGPDIASGRDAIQQGSPWQSSLAALLPWLVFAWSCGVALLTVRVWRHWRRLKALVRMAEALPAWRARAHELAVRFGLRRGVDVLCSGQVATPTLMGWLRPVIILPIAVCCGFPAAQVELILAHELAHLRRWDHFANLFQVILETLLFYHPVVHWISRDVRNEREISCDALALGVTGGSRRDLVAALVELEEFRESHAGLVLAASGGILLERVWHITGSTRGASLAQPPARFVGVMLGSLLALLTLSLQWRQAETRRDLADSMSSIQTTLVPQLLSVSIGAPALVIKDMVPKRIALPRPRLHRQQAMATESPGDQTTADIVDARHLVIAAPMRVVDLVPSRIVATRQPVPERAAPSAQIAAPTPIHVEQPVYPQGALDQGIEGQVVIEFGLNSDGSVRAPVVVDARPSGVFDHAAARALRGWKFAVTHASDFTDRRYRQTMSFTLHPASSNTATPGLVVQAKAVCHVVTGTHLCRADIGEAGATVTRILH